MAAAARTTASAIGARTRNLFKAMKIPFRPFKSSRPLAVEWTDHFWTPRVTACAGGGSIRWQARGRRSLARFSTPLISPRNAPFAKSKPMMKSSFRSPRARRLHLDRAAGGHRHHRHPGRTAAAGPGLGQKERLQKRALYEMQHIVAAIGQYEATYSRMPLSTASAASLSGVEARVPARISPLELIPASVGRWPTDVPEICCPALAISAAQAIRQIIPS